VDFCRNSCVRFVCSQAIPEWIRCHVRIQYQSRVCVAQVRLGIGRFALVLNMSQLVLWIAVAGVEYMHLTVPVTYETVLAACSQAFGKLRPIRSAFSEIPRVVKGPFAQGM